MFFRRYINLLCIAWLTCFSITTVQAADSVLKPEPVGSLSATVFDALPTKCIALRQGRQCFTTVKLKVKLAALGDYCVYKNGVAKPLSCLGDVLEETLVVDFQSRKKVSYSLVNQRSNRVVGIAEVDVGWVHKKTSRKRRWRLF